MRKPSKYELHLKYDYNNIKDFKDNMLREFLSIENLVEAYRLATRGETSFRSEATKFSIYPEKFLIEMREDIINDAYIGLPYRKHTLKERKTRTIYAPCFTDKILHHAFNNIVREFYERRFYKHSYSCQRDKGTETCTLALQRFQRYALKYYKDPYLLKLDITKFFYSIDRDILISILLKDGMPEKMVMLLKRLWDKYENPKGLPLGNLTSQMFANSYLDPFDKYIIHILKIKCYVRYADDMFFIVDGKEQAEELRIKAESYLTQILKLEVNPRKVYIVKAKEFDGIGCKYKKGLMYPLGRNKKMLRSYYEKYDIDNIKQWIARNKYCRIENLIRYNCEKYCVPISLLEISNTPLNLCKK